MASWFNSLDSVVRLHGLMSWITILAALVAVACGIFAYILSNQATALREQAKAQVEPPLQAAPEKGQRQTEAEQLQVQLEQEVKSLTTALEKSQQQAQQLEEEAAQARRGLDDQRKDTEAARQEAAQKQSELAGALSELDDLKAAFAAQENPFSAQKRAKLLRALSDKSTGEVTVVSVAGNESSQSLAQGLQETLQKAGWTAILREGRFASQPEGLYFVVHSQESMPQFTLQLAIGLAVIDLMPMPAKIRVNPEKPPGSLGIVVGAIKP